MAHAYFAANLDRVKIGDLIEVGGVEARHAITVARIRTDERIRLLDGAGTSCVAQVVSVSDKTFVARSVEQPITEPINVPKLTLIQALAKGGRDELAVQAAVELGVDAIIPWQAERSIVKWSATKATKQHERWVTIVREASKQSLRSRVPDVYPLAKTKDIERIAAEESLIVLDPRSENALGEAKLSAAAEIAVIVGPEGGISDAEMERFVAAGAHRFRLGNHVLRTSTAGPTALSVLLTMLYRW